MLIATVLDSFCIDNGLRLCKTVMPFGRFMGIYTLLFQDGPQMLIHIYFMIFIHNDISHSELTVVMSLIVSAFAIQISIFNIVMCGPNEFDPIMLELELKRRNDKIDKHQEKIMKQKEELKKKIAGMNTRSAPLNPSKKSQFVPSLMGSSSNPLAKMIGSEIEPTRKTMPSMNALGTEKTRTEEGKSHRNLSP